MRDDPTQDQAVKSLTSLRDTMQAYRSIHRGPNTHVPVVGAKIFNEALVTLTERLGKDYVRSAIIHPRSFVPASQDYPVESVSLRRVLSGANDALHKLHSE